jgi:hypothetical protein
VTGSLGRPLSPIVQPAPLLASLLKSTTCGWWSNTEKRVRVQVRDLSEKTELIGRWSSLHRCWRRC